MKEINIKNATDLGNSKPSLSEEVMLDMIAPKGASNNQVIFKNYDHWIEKPEEPKKEEYSEFLTHNFWKTTTYQIDDLLDDLS